MEKERKVFLPRDTYRLPRGGHEEKEEIVSKVRMQVLSVAAPAVEWLTAMLFILSPPFLDSLKKWERRRGGSFLSSFASLLLHSAQEFPLFSIYISIPFLSFCFFVGFGEGA